MNPTSRAIFRTVTTTDGSPTPAERDVVQGLLSGEVRRVEAFGAVGRSLAMASAGANMAELRAKLTAMEPSTWREIRDEVLTRPPTEIDATLTQALPLKQPFAA